jgi:hypothetical protein
MNIIAHRINSIQELEKVNKSYGVEIDLRSNSLDIVLEHEALKKETDIKSKARSKEIEKAIADLKEQGLVVNEGYGYNAPSLPSDITDMIEEHVMDLYSKYVAYLEFISLQRWCAEVDKVESEKNLSLFKSKKKLELKSSGKALAMIDAEIEVDPGYQEKANALQELTNYHGLINIISERLSKDISLINREITRRVNINKSVGRNAWMTP